MKNNKGILIGAGILVVIAIAAGVLLAVNSSSKNSSGAYGSDSMNNMNMDTKKADSTKSQGTTATDTTNAVATNTVTIQNYAFDAPVIKVKVGDTVTWTNKDGVKHDIAPDSPSADFTEGKLIGNGETYSFTFKKAGTYAYHCTPHPYMKGTVVVTQ